MLAELPPDASTRRVLMVVQRQALDIPFHALEVGERLLIERHEVVYVESLAGIRSPTMTSDGDGAPRPTPKCLRRRAVHHPWRRCTSRRAPTGCDRGRSGLGRALMHGENGALLRAELSALLAQHRKEQPRGRAT